MYDRHKASIHENQRFLLKTCSHQHEEWSNKLRDYMHASSAQDYELLQVLCAFYVYKQKEKIISHENM
jgi:hypothetical protein